MCIGFAALVSHKDIFYSVISGASDICRLLRALPSLPSPSPFYPGDLIYTEGGNHHGEALSVSLVPAPSQGVSTKCPISSLLHSSPVQLAVSPTELSPSETLCQSFSLTLCPCHFPKVQIHLPTGLSPGGLGRIGDLSVFPVPGPQKLPQD